jgi:hypothetical protein
MFYASGQDGAERQVKPCRARLMALALAVFVLD